MRYAHCHRQAAKVNCGNIALLLLAFLITCLHFHKADTVVARGWKTSIHFANLHVTIYNPCTIIDERAT